MLMLSLLICVFVQESLLDADHHVAVALGATNMSGSAASVFYRDDASVLSSVSVFIIMSLLEHFIPHHKGYGH